MKDILIVAVLVVVIGLAAWYLIRAKKEGRQVHWLPQRRFLRQVRLQRL